MFPCAPLWAKGSLLFSPLQSVLTAARGIWVKACRSSAQNPLVASHPMQSKNQSPHQQLQGLTWSAWAHAHPNSNALLSDFTSHPCPPATLASLRFLDPTKHSSESEPLHLLFPQSRLPFLLIATKFLLSLPSKLCLLTRLHYSS